MKPVLVDEKGREVEGRGVTGALCMAVPWPGIARCSTNNLLYE